MSWTSKETNVTYPELYERLGSNSFTATIDLTGEEKEQGIKGPDGFGILILKEDEEENYTIPTEIIYQDDPSNYDSDERLEKLLKENYSGWYNEGGPKETWNESDEVIEVLFGKVENKKFLYLVRKLVRTREKPKATVTPNPRRRRSGRGR